jgi:hypothetical protein
MLTPKFSLCPSAHGTNCSVGSLPQNQAIELQITDQIGKKASAGEQIGITVTVQGLEQDPSNVPLSSASASIDTVLDQPSSSPTPTSPPTTTVPGLPGTTITPGSISSLFPTVTPSATPRPSGDRGGKHKVTKVTSTASSLPLDPRLIGGQVAGLAVLAAAITMAVARLSLRTPQPAAPAPPTAAPASPPAKTEDPEPTSAATKVDEDGPADS